MKAIIFDFWFEAPDELNEFCKSIGYENPNYSDFELMFDSRVVEFCEQRLSRFRKDWIYKGRDTHKMLIGFAGAGHIMDIDTSRKWTIRYDCSDNPVVEYLDVETNDWGFTRLVNHSGGTKV